MGKAHPAHQPPQPERQHRNDDDHGDEHRRHLIYQPLHRGAAPLCLLHQPDDLCQHSGTAHAGCSHLEAPRHIERRPSHGVVAPLSNRHTLARQHTFVHATAAVEEHTVYRDFLTGAHDHHITHAHGVNRHIGFVAATQHAGSTRLQPHQCLDRRARLALGTRFKKLPYKNERNNQCRRLEVDVPTETEQQQANAIEVCRRRAKRNQRVHAGGAGLQRLPRLHIKVTPTIELHGRCQHQKQPVPQVSGGRVATVCAPCCGTHQPRREQPEVFRHRDEEQRHTKDHRHQQPPLPLGNVAGTRVGFGIVGRTFTGWLHRPIPSFLNSSANICPARHRGQITHNCLLTGKVDLS